MGRKAHTTKKDKFKKMFPEGRKAFAKAKKKAGIKGATKHSEIREKLTF